MKSKKIAFLLSVVMTTQVMGSTLTMATNEVNSIAASEQESIDDDKVSNMRYFELQNHPNYIQYRDMFRIKPDEIKNITTNGGHAGSNTPEKAVDDDLGTTWETGIKNTDDFKNEFIVEFEEIQTIERMTYKVRNTRTGFLQKYEIYGSTSSDGDDYELIARGSGSETMHMVEITFEPTEVKRVKIVFLEAGNGWTQTPNNGWASIADLAFYYDPLSTEVYSIFEDNLATTLKADYDTIEEIEALENEISDHPFRDEFMNSINLAKDIINGVALDNRSEVITLSQRGNEVEEALRLDQRFFLGNLDLTGYYVMPGDFIEVYVDANEDDVLPQLVLAQVGDVDTQSSINLNHRFDLNVGMNLIVAPEDLTKPFAVYFSNRALPNEQEYAPNVMIGGDALQQYPIYIDGKTDVEEYIKQVESHTGADMTDVMGDKFLVSTTNSKAKEAYVDGEATPLDLVREMNKMIEIFDVISGVDENDPNPLHRPTTALYHAKFTNQYLIYAKPEFVHGLVNAADEYLAGDIYFWGMLHEFGHQLENYPLMIGEVTNNFYTLTALLMSGISQEERFESSQQVIDEFLMTREGAFEDGHENEFDYFAKLLGIYQIINYFGIEAYSEAFRRVREDMDQYPVQIEDVEETQLLVAALSDVTGYDLAPHFEIYNYPVLESTKEFTSQYKVLDKKIEYTLVTAYEMKENNVETFNDETKAVIEELLELEDGFQLKVSTNNNNDGTVVYEIYRNGELIDINRDGIYTDIVDIEGEYEYEVIAYDYRVNESIKSDAVSTVGKYITKEVYASDKEWESATTGWSNIGIDQSVNSSKKILLNVDRYITNFDKGIAVVADSEIVYDLTDKKYTYFRAYVGHDRNHYVNGTSFVASILVDGEEVYKSNVMTSGAAADFVEISLEGASEIRLVIDDNGDGITGDFASWADAKFEYIEKEDNSHTVLFELNGGTGNFPAQKVNHGEAPVVTEEPTKSGYVFGGWYADSNLTTPVELSELSIEENTKLYAKWNVARTLSFNLNGGEGNFPPQLVALGGNPVEPTEEPTKEGYVFAGWYIDSRLTKPMIFENWVMNNNGSVFAKWEEAAIEHTVSFELNGGTGEFPDQIVTEGEAPVVTEEPTRSGYVFGGWYADSNLTTPVELSELSVEEDITVYAKWNVARTLSFNLNGGQGNFPDQIIAVGGNPTAPTEEPTKEGYVFVGWYIDSALTKPMIFEEWVMNNSGTTFAKWEEVVEYTVSFELNGGTGEFPNQIVTEGEAPVVTEEPTRSGYVFGGWYADSNLTTPIELSELSVEEDITVYAKWNAARTLSFNLNGGQGNFPDQIIAVGGNPTAPTEEPTKEGYVFVGWYIDSALTKPMIFEEWVMNNSGTTFAKWELAN